MLFWFLFKRKFNFFSFICIWIYKFGQNSLYIFPFQNKFFTGAFFPKKNISRKMKKKKRFRVLDIWWDFILCKWNLLKKKKRCDQKILYNLLMKCFLLLFFSYWIIWIWFSFVRLLNICFLFLTQAKENKCLGKYIFRVVGFVFHCFSIYIQVYK